MMGVCMPLVVSGQQVEVEDDGFSELKVRFRVEDVRGGDTERYGRGFGEVTVEGYGRSLEVGRPNLPVFSALIEVPKCEGFEVTVERLRVDTVPLSEWGISYPLLPLQPSRSKSDTARYGLTIDEEVYWRDAFWGMEVAEVEAVGVARDRWLARLQYSPMRYNPVRGLVEVCREAVVRVRYVGADEAGTMAHFSKYYSGAFFSGAVPLNSLYPKAVRSEAPIRYLIVAHSMFRGHLNGFVEWKRRKGFLVDVAYTDEPQVGTSDSAIASYIRSQYTEATPERPAPTYLLLVGDVEQVPAFGGVTSSDHITDLYYTTWTAGDNLPDCYCGRFSAQTLAQLTPQVEKTLMYEQYTFADPSFLDRAVLVAGVDHGEVGDYGYTHADPTMDYVATNYVNGAHGYSEVYYFKNNTARVPSATPLVLGSSEAGNAPEVRCRYNQGAGLINYSAHGSPTSWATPNFNTTHVGAMTNTQRFGLMIGNCCLSNKFEVQNCFGEALLCKDNYCGAVGYIGGSNSTYWYEDVYWSVGLRSTVSATMSMGYTASRRGAYDCAFHTHGEAYSQWATSQGAMMMAGNMAVQASSSSLKLYYWEIYHLMGDPSVATYLSQADEIALEASPLTVCGSSVLHVSAVPHAYVALTDSATLALVAAGFADNAGMMDLSLPDTLAAGTYLLAASAPQYRTSFMTVRAVPAADRVVYVSQLEAGGTLTAGEEEALTVTVRNDGDSAAHDVVVRLASSSPYLVISPDSLYVGTVEAHTVMDIALPYRYHIVTLSPDMTHHTIKASTEWIGCEEPLVVEMVLTSVAPKMVVEVEEGRLVLRPGDSVDVAVRLTNRGHAQLPEGGLVATSPTGYVEVEMLDTAPFSLARRASVQRRFRVRVSEQMPDNVVVPLRLSLVETLGVLDDTVGIVVGEWVEETFEGGAFHVDGWVQGSRPWSWVNTSAHGGSYCLRSAAGLSDNQTSDISLTCWYENADSLVFYYAVSSEANYDMFQLYIDGENVLSASGERAWTRAALAVERGEHTFRFAYEKDYSYSSGSDCVWVDDILLPPVVRPAVYREVIVCNGDEYVLFGDTIDGSVPGVYDGSGVVDDTVVVVSCRVMPVVEGEESVTACDRYEWDGEVYTESTVAVAVYTSEDGCDSVATLHLQIVHSSVDTIEVAVEAEEYVWHDSVYTSSGIYEQGFVNEDGCDSVVVMRLTLMPPAGIDDMEGSKYSVHPNPTSGKLHFGGAVSRARLYSVHGRVIKEVAGADGMDISMLPSGCYLLCLQNEQGEEWFRVLKQ